MPKNQTKQQRRDIFAEAAYNIIVERGFSRVTMRDVAERAGFTTGAVVHYARTKDALLVESYNFVRRLAYQQLLEAERMEPVDGLRHLLHWFLPADGTQSGYWSIRFSLKERSRENPDMEEHLTEGHEELQAWMARLVQKALESRKTSKTTDAVKAAQTALALLVGLSTSYLIEDKETASRTSREIIDHWIDAAL